MPRSIKCPIKQPHTKTKPVTTATTTTKRYDEFFWLVEKNLFIIPPRTYLIRKLLAQKFAIYTFKMK